MLIDPALRQSDGRAETQAAWQRRSIDNVWHPCTQMQRLGTVPPLPIARGEGAWLHDYAGARYFDANSSWWLTFSVTRTPASMRRCATNWKPCRT